MRKEEDEELDFDEIFHKLWPKRKFIITITGIFAAIGIFIAIFSPVSYTAFCTMVPQTAGKSTDNDLEGLASIAGITMNNRMSGSLLSPRVYPKIVSNINFQKELIYSKFHFNDVEQPISLYDYYSDNKYRKFNIINALKTYTIGLPGLIIGRIGSLFGSKKDDISHLQMGDTLNAAKRPAIQALTSTETAVQGIVKSNLSLAVESKEGYITLRAKMPEALAAAELAQRGQELLQKYITKFKLEKVASNLSFVEQSYLEAKGNFESKQSELARFRDANKNFASAVAKTHEEKLISEYTLLLGVYTELSKQKEQAKISVTETTPILTIIEPVVVPIGPSKPNQLINIFLLIFMGFSIACGLILLKPYLKALRKPVVKAD